jgi:hypothetical protein
MIQMKVRLILFALGMHFGSAAIAANHIGPFLYFIYDRPLETVLQEGNAIRAPGNDRNVFSLAANFQCNQSAFLTLRESQQDSIEEARVLSQQTGRSVYVYEIGSNINVYSLRRTIRQYLAQVRQPYRTQLENYMRTDLRRFTPIPIRLEQIHSALTIDAYSSSNIENIPYFINTNYDGRAGGINPNPYLQPGYFPPWQETEQYIRFIVTAYESTRVDACTAQPFACSAPPPNSYMTAASQTCIAPDEIVKVPWRSALAYQLLPVLFSSSLSD